ncbi:DUF484 family protein [Brevundimonas sp. 2R-24]|uniref:DUF484 family protein n=1 Tax=Peiella sedimenti TaxID=3061083 RepID=A0ABT8SL87_9CAUL|nr:DUF484 family protein [Caulobacteraceae bacterium XZ-24]
MSKTAGDLFESVRGPAWPEVRHFLEVEPEHLLADRALLETLGLKRTGPNVVDFGPAALSRLEAVIEREGAARKAIEQVARANFAAQAQTHVAALDLMEARNHTDLARRLDAAAQARFGLAGATLLIEKPGGVPFGWRPLESGDVDGLLGENGLTWLGPVPRPEVLFPPQTVEAVSSVALVRLSPYSPVRPALVAFGSSDPEGFTRDMGCELAAFLARVAERMVERWPILDPDAA